MDKLFKRRAKLFCMQCGKFMGYAQYSKKEIDDIGPINNFWDRHKYDCRVSTNARRRHVKKRILFDQFGATMRAHLAIIDIQKEFESSDRFYNRKCWTVHSGNRNLARIWGIPLYRQGIDRFE